MIFRWIDVQNKHSISCKNLHHSSRLYNGMLSCYPLGNATVEIHAETLTPWITRAGERYNMLFDRANKRIMTPNAEIHTGQTATFFIYSIATDCTKPTFNARTRRLGLHEKHNATFCGAQCRHCSRERVPVINVPTHWEVAGGDLIQLYNTDTQRGRLL